MFYVYLWLILVVGILVVGILFGIFIGTRLKKDEYHGILKITETDQGLGFLLDFAGDPENLVNHKEVKLLVVPPNYDKLLSQ